MAHAISPTLQPEKLNIGSVAGRLGIPALVIGVIALCVVASRSFVSEEMTLHFFHSYLTAYSFFMAITLGALAFVIIQHLTHAGWSVTVRRIAEGIALNMFLMVLLMVPFVIPVGPNHQNGIQYLFHWFNPANVSADENLQAKHGYLNPQFFAVRMAIYLLFWMGLAWFYSAKSVEQDKTGDPKITLQMERVSYPAIILFAFSLTAFIIDWVMSLNAHWFSTIFGVYYFAGCILSALAAIVLLSLLLQKRGLIGHAINHEHYQDLGKLMFAFTFFWGYIAFSQYMLIWYSNLPEETQFYLPRQIGIWGSLSLLLLVVHLLIPFPGLMSRHVKRRNAILAFWAVWTLAACAVDQYWLVMPNEWIGQIPAEVSRTDHDQFGHEISPNIELQSALPYLLDGAHPENATHHIYAITGVHEEFNERINFPFQAESVLVTVLCFVGMGGLYVFSTMQALKNKSLVPTKDPRLAEALAFQNI